VSLEVWQMQGLEAKILEVLQGKNLSDPWSVKISGYRSQRVPFELPISYTQDYIMEVNDYPANS
jgi:hypothetical protein